MQVTPYYPSPIDFADMAKTLTREIVARNLAALMKAKGLTSQAALAKRADVSQKTISNLLNPGQGVKSPTLDKVTAVATALGIEMWHFLLPEIPESAGDFRTLSQVVCDFVQSPPEGRVHIARVAEMERKLSDQ